MFKPANLRRVFWGLLGLGAMRSIERLVSFYIFYDSSIFSITVPQLLKDLLLSFSPAALAYILYWFVKQKHGDEPEDEAQEKPPRPLRPDEEGISDEDLGKIVKKATWVFYILAMVGLMLYYGPRLK